MGKPELTLLKGVSMKNKIPDNILKDIFQRNIGTLVQREIIPDRGENGWR